MLQGIISMGDIHRAANDDCRSVKINTKFTRLNGYEYMRARQIFLDNEKINALPVADSDNRLLGDYARWDDELSVVDFHEMENDKFEETLRRKIKRAAFVRAADVHSDKNTLMEQCRTILTKRGIETEVISRDGIFKACERNDVVLIVGEDEQRGLETLYRDICNKNMCEWGRKVKKLVSFIDLLIAEEEGNALKALSEDIMKKISSSGIFLMTIQCKDNGSDYWKALQADLDAKFLEIGKERSVIFNGEIFYRELWKDFFDEIYTGEYATEISKLSFSMVKNHCVIKFKDQDSKLLHVKNGERLTVGQPEVYQRSIYFFGPCVMIGCYVEDAHTIESYLQDIINRSGYPIRVVNCGSFSDERSLLERICLTGFKKGDIAVVYDKNKCFDGIPSVNLADCLERNNVSEKWMVDDPIHCNYRVNRLYAEELFSFLECELKKITEKNGAENAELPQDVLTAGYIKGYFSDFHPEGTVGSIVMNCNPFSYGHRYLIEQALKQVDNLIIFVVQEDKSLFTFRERYAMVLEGTRDLDNVTVVPSGNLILSQLTFPEYFVKVEDEDLENHVEYDITLFAEQIAPKLNITYRFVGEEKADAVTNRYNLAMKKILPEHGIKLVEIPRKKTADGESVVSATKVREILARNGELAHARQYGENGKPAEDELTGLIPESTRRLLLQSRDFSHFTS